MPACDPTPLPQGNLVAVGTHKGFVQIWDAAAGKKLSVLEGHTARVGEARAPLGGNGGHGCPGPAASLSPLCPPRGAGLERRAALVRQP